MEQALEIPAVIDIEASGFGRGSYPIEVGMAMPDRKTHCMLIKPEPEWTHWDLQAEEIHGISREILDDRGVPAQIVAGILNRLASRTTFYSDAWSYDNSWVSLLFEHANLPQHFRIETIRSILSEHQLQCWDEVKLEVIQELDLKRHRASADAIIIQTTYLRTKESGLIAQGGL